MTPKNMPKLEDWESEKMLDSDFRVAAGQLEIGYQITRLRIMRGFTQAQLAEMLGCRQYSIARLENGSKTPSLSLLNRIAEALSAEIEFRLIPKTN